MKRIIAALLLLALVLTAAGCGSKKPETEVNLDALYKHYEEKLPAMLSLDADGQMNFMGIDAADCQQSLVSICAEGLRADEIWLIQAKDADALERLHALAEARLTIKAEETESYVPDQYAIVKEAKLLTRGLYLALIVSPDAEEMAEAFQK